MNKKFVLPLISARFKDGHTKPYFEGIVECIKYHDLPKMYVSYELIERYDKRLAITIRDQSPRFYTLALSFFSTNIECWFQLKSCYVILGFIMI